MFFLSKTYYTQMNTMTGNSSFGTLNPGPIHNYIFYLVPKDI